MQKEEFAPEFQSNQFRCPLCSKVDSQRWMIYSKSSLVPGSIGRGDSEPSKAAIHHARMEAIYADARSAVSQNSMKDKHKIVHSEEKTEVENNIFARHKMRELRDRRMRENLRNHVTILKQGKEVWVSLCANCDHKCLWVGNKMILPEEQIIIPKELPKEIKKIYKEAALVAKHSPRASAALLRAVLEQICIHHGCKKGSLLKKTQNLMKAKQLEGSVIEDAIETLRGIGNKAAHQVLMTEHDNDSAVKRMFRVIDFIVNKLFVDPGEIKADLAALKKKKSTKPSQKKSAKSKKGKPL